MVGTDALTDSCPWSGLTHPPSFPFSLQLTDIFYQIDLLLGPVLVILITWTFTYLAVALAEKQVRVDLYVWV